MSTQKETYLQIGLLVLVSVILALTIKDQANRITSLQHLVDFHAHRIDALEKK